MDGHCAEVAPAAASAFHAALCRHLSTRAASRACRDAVLPLRILFASLWNVGVAHDVREGKGTVSPTRTLLISHRHHPSQAINLEFPISTHRGLQLPGENPVCVVTTRVVRSDETDVLLSASQSAAADGSLQFSSCPSCVLREASLQCDLDLLSEDTLECLEPLHGHPLSALPRPVPNQAIELRLLGVSQ